MADTWRKWRIEVQNTNEFIAMNADGKPFLKMAEVADRHSGKAVNIDELAGTETYGNHFQSMADSLLLSIQQR